MSDSLVLTGVKDIKKHTGTEMLRLLPTGGGDTFQLKQWWVKGGVSTCYTDATVFNVTQAGNTVKLAIASNMSTNLNIAVNDNFQFNFFNFNEVNRAALFTDAFELIEEYVFPKISGGKVMTVIPAGAAVRPVVADPVAFSGDGSITGTLDVGDTITITSAPYSGGLGTTTMSNILQTSVNGTSNWLFGTSSTQGSYTFVLPGTLDGLYLRQSTQVTDDDGLVSRNSTAVGPVTTPPTFTGVTLTGPTTSTDTSTETYTASKSGTANDVTYVLTSSDSNDTISGLDVTFDGAGARTLTLTGTSVSVGDTQTDTLGVTVS